jgi:sirohydrochlorin cobaltochelatase
MLILIAHGSRDPRWRASVEQMTELLQADLGSRKVRLAYMDCSPPTLDEVVSEAVQAGATKIRVLPLFLADQGHVERNVAPAVKNLQRTHPAVELELLPSVGHHPLFLELIRTIATRIGQ